jgi:hypothetical protein
VLWMLLCGAIVIAGYAVTAQFGRNLGEYWTGLICLFLFAFLGWYGVRKRALWFSLRVMRITGALLPQSLQRRVVALDRLETWRAVHITVGTLTILPLWWHMSGNLMSPFEALLALAVALLLLSGIFGVVLQDYLPPLIQALPEHEVRLQDVDARINAIYVEAEEMILGHSEALVQAYLEDLKPILEHERTLSSGQFLRATLARRDPGAEACAAFHRKAQQFRDDAPVWAELVELAARKINLEHNAFNLHFSTDWLTFHLYLAIFTFGLLFFHVASVLYFEGI